MQTASLIRTSTYGWDTVYAVRFSELNKAIVRQKTSPRQLEESVQDEGDTYRVSGEFGDWQLTTGGDGRNLRLALPLTASTYTTPTQVYALSPLTLVVEVSLAWVNTGPRNGADTHELRVGGATATAVVLADLTDWGSNTLGEASKSFYTALVQNWLGKHLGSFQQVFSTLSMNRQLDDSQEGFQWLMPTGTPLYAVTDRNDELANSFFGVLCMTENRPAPGTHQLDAFAIPDGAASAFLISPERIITNMLLPGMQFLFAGKPGPDQFLISPDGRTISNKNALKFSEQSLENGRHVYPRIKAGNFGLEVRDNRIDMMMSGLYFDFLPGTTVTITHSSSVGLAVSDTNHFKMDVVGTPLTSATITSSTGVLAAQIVGTIAAALFGAAMSGVVGALAEGGATFIASSQNATIAAIRTAVTASVGRVTNILPTAFAGAAAGLSGMAAPFTTFFAANWGKIFAGTVGIVAGGMASLVPSIVGYFANELASEVPTLDEFGTQALAQLKWPLSDKEGYKLVGGSLNGALQLIIALPPEPAAI